MNNSSFSDANLWISAFVGHDDEEFKRLNVTIFSEIIGNLKVHEMNHKKDSRNCQKLKLKGNYCFKAKKRSSDEESVRTSGFLIVGSEGVACGIVHNQFPGTSVLLLLRINHKIDIC
ncbi:hypothetical protein Tco_0060944 [Tanacetum coccineum]